MAIINTNTITLSDSGLPLESSVIIGHDFQGSCRQPSVLNVNMQVNFFASIEKWQESIKNALHVKGFTKISEFVYNSETDIKDIMYFFDLKLKDYIMTIYPTWDPDKLVITTEPTE